MEEELDVEKLEHVEGGTPRNYDEAKAAFEEKFGQDPTMMSEEELKDIQAGRPVAAVPNYENYENYEAGRPVEAVPNYENYGEGRTR